MNEFFQQDRTVKNEEYNSDMNFIDIFYPKFCVVCSVYGDYVCKNCTSLFVPLEEQRCSACERVSELGFTHFECQNKTPLFASISLYSYSGVIKTMLKEIKYKRFSQMTKDILKTSEGSIYKAFFPFRKFISGNAAIQPVPLHPNRIKTRGFNQAYYIAQQLSIYLQIPTISLVERVIDTPAQVIKQEKQDRIENVRGAFKLSQKYETHDTIIVVDDVYTTGSTCKEVGNELKKTGVKNIISFTIAHG